MNSTPEPTGERKAYFIRVMPPEIARTKQSRLSGKPLSTTTALGAVASTFQMTSDEYAKIGQQS
jgi:hypothetical protein